MSTKLAELEKAKTSLEMSMKLLRESVSSEAEAIEKHKAFRDSCIQRFEFCVEMSWKTAARAVGLKAQAPKIIVRELAQSGIIDDPQLWFKFIEARNRSSHTYIEAVACEVYDVIVDFLPELNTLLNRLMVFV